MKFPYLRLPALTQTAFRAGFGDAEPIHRRHPAVSLRALCGLGAGLLFFCACLAVRSSAAPQLQVATDGANIILAWPTNAAGFRIQARDGLSGFDYWNDVEGVPALAEALQFVVLPGTNEQQFFRLFKDAGTNPVVGTLAVSTNALALGAAATLQFDILEPDLDLGALVLTWTNVLGSFSNIMSAASIGLGEAVTQAVLPIRPDQLPIGTSYFKLRLVDRMGLSSPPVYFEITVVGQDGPGTAPQLVSLAAEAAGWQPMFDASSRLKPGFVLRWNDADGDIERIRATLHVPLGGTVAKELHAVRVGITNLAGTNTLRPFTLTFNEPTGTYLADFQLIDRTGRTSAVHSVQFQLDFSAPPPPQISYFVPDTGAPGTPVQLYAQNLDSLGTNFQVTLAGVPCPVLTNQLSYLSLIVPTGAVTAPFKITAAAQVVASPASFVVTPFILLTSDRDAAAPGEPVQFSTSIRSATNRHVTFSVNGIPGGNAAVGLISSNGLYVLPLLPPTNLMTITAKLTTQPSVTATALVQVLPPVSLGGMGFVSAAQGGEVSTTAGDAVLTVPPGALASDAFLNLATLRGTNLPLPSPGRRLLGGVRLGPDGTVFSQLVSVTVPLAEARPPGTVLALKYFIRTNGTFVDEGLTATVASNGREAVGQVLHFSEVVVDETEVVVASGPPQITTLRTALTFYEGLTVPVLITGQNLVPGLRIEVLRDGQPTDDVVPSNAIFETNRMGLLLTSSTLRDLDFCCSRNYELRVVNGANQSASTNLLVRGLDELIIAPGVHTNLSGVKNFSEVEVGAGAVVTGEARWFVNGPVHVAGQIITRGQKGASSVDEAPGVNPAYSDFRRGGDGGEPDEYGADGFLRPSAQGDFSYGDGGAPGEDIESISSFFLALFNIVTCISGDAYACGAIVTDFIQGVIVVLGDVSDMEAGEAVGRPGMPGARADADALAGAGYGGGGGGGGGDLNLFDEGEGGGAGGNGGSGVFIISRGDIRLDGQVDTSGGDGGDGGENIVTVVSGWGVNFQDTPSSNRGGGGGGGSGGSISLLARGGFRLGPGGGVLAKGGNPGNSLFTFLTIDAATRNVTTQRVQFVEANYPATPGGRIHTQGALVPAHNLPDLVTDHGLLQVVLPPAASVFSPEVTVTIRGENTNQVREIPFVTGESGVRRANLLFFPGFNTVSASDGRTLDHPDLHRQVLYLAGPDTDGDGLSDADEIVLGTNPAATDTDNDGLSDLAEILDGLDPLTNDSDGDLLPDTDELTGGTDPLKRDTDGDGFWDGWEIQAGNSPFTAQTSIAALPSGTLLAEVGSSVNGRVLAVVNPVTGRMAALGRVNGGLGFGIAFTADGKLLASRGDRLVQVALDRPADVAGQLAVTNLGNFSTNGPVIYCYTLASAPYGGLLLGIESTAGGDSTGQFLSINPTTGLATRVGTIQPNPLHALAVLGSGSTQEMLYASSAQAAAPDALLTFPTGTGGAAQSVGTFNWTNVYGLTPAAPQLLHAALTGDPDSLLALVNATNGAATNLATLTAPVFDLARRPCPVPCFSGPYVSPLADPGRDLVTADFNNDGRADLAVLVSRTVGPDQYVGVAIQHGQGDGTFTNASTHFFVNARSFSDPDLALADVNGDGRKDIIVMQAAVVVGVFQTLIRPAELMTLLADGDGGFQSPVIQAMPAGAAQKLRRITAADWSGDGKADLVFVNESYQSAYTLQGNGSGLYTNPVSLLPGTQVNGVLLADVNADSQPDLLGVGYGLKVRLADGAGGFLTNQSFGSSSGTFISVGNVDADGDVDVVTTDYGAVPTVYYNAGAGTFPTNATFNPRNFPAGVFARAAVGDLSGDGRADAMVPSVNTTATAFLSGQAPLTLAHTMTEPASAPFETGRVVSNLVMADLNNDGRLDVIVVGGNGIAVLLGEPPF